MEALDDYKACSRLFFSWGKWPLGFLSAWYKSLGTGSWYQGCVKLQMFVSCYVNIFRANTFCARSVITHRVHVSVPCRVPRKR